MGADTLMTGDMALLRCSMPAPCCPYSMKSVESVGGRFGEPAEVPKAGAIKFVSRERRKQTQVSDHQWMPKATFDPFHFPHGERGDEEDLADRCRFDRSTRGSVIRIDERDCAFVDGNGSHASRAARDGCDRPQRHPLPSACRM